MPTNKASKRKRIFTRKRHKHRQYQKEFEDKSIYIDNEVTTARGRLKGALMDALEQSGEESDDSIDYSPVKRERRVSNDQSHSSGDEESPKPKPPQRQSYVLKLFDRSVDLSQFNEDSPLYPICRAWIANRPKARYSDIGKEPTESPSEDSIELPGPEGPPISRIPDLIPEQKECNKDNINLNYHGVCPSREQLVAGHRARWGAVRAAWARRAAAREARYAATQATLSDIYTSSL